MNISRVRTVGGLKNFRCLSVVLLVLAFAPASVNARFDILGEWQSTYPNSLSDDIGDSGCQVCHQNTNGNEPWNAYGWDLRQRINNGFTISQAIRFAADEDPDGNGVQSLDEINDNFQPGWTEGANNTLYFSDGGTLTGQLPPTVPSTTAIDHPAALADPLPAIGSGSISLALHEVAGSFNAPLKAVRAPGIDGSIFVVEQTGKILRVDLTSGEKTVFHNVAAELVPINPSYDERGLLGLVFHPDFATNGRFFTYQSEPFDAANEADFSTMPPATSPDHRSALVEYKVVDPSCNSSVQKVKTILTVDQPQANHNGGDLAFDDQGYLYVSIGDGGAANDAATGHGARGNGRDNTNPLGAILRIDVEGSNSANARYGIPASNPFAGMGDPGLDEIYAYGFRNAFRFSFDAANGDFYAADVGQFDVEEINLVESGGNYGWNWQEGSFGFYDYLLPDDSTFTYVSAVLPPGLPNDLIDPIAQYDHDDGSSVTGGYVYRGDQMPALVGRYVFADWNQRLFYLDSENQINEFLGSGITEFITGFGEDSASELYIVTNDGFNPSGVAGRLLKLQAVGADYLPPQPVEEEIAQCPPSEEICAPIKTSDGKIALVCL